MKLESARLTPRGISGVCPSFVRALSHGDLGDATACFARDGCLITPDATAVHGRDEIRTVLAQMVARRTKVTVESSNLLRGGGVILVRERWRLRSGEHLGTPIEQTFDAILALRRVEGTWKLAIAAPWGWGTTGS